MQKYKCPRCGKTVGPGHKCTGSPKMPCVFFVLLFSICVTSTIALSIPLDTAATFAAGFPYEYKRGQPVTLMARGSGTNAMYIMEVDPTTGGIPVSGTVTANNASIGATGAAVPASATYIAGKNAGNLVGVAVSAGGVVSVDGSAVTQPVSAASLPLPTGASTSALQTTGNTSLSSIDTKTPALVSGRVPVDGSGVTQPVSGTVAVSNFPATQPVSGTVTANQGGAPWTVTGTGTAGTAATGVLTVQGIAAMTALKVDGSAVTQPVSGTVSAAQSGTWTVQPGNTANTTAWKVDGSAVTQPVSGTVTSNIGTTNGLALDATVAKLNVSQGTALGANTGPMIQGSVTTAAPTYTTGNINPISLTTAGAVRTDASGTTQPVSGTVAATQSGTWTVQPGNTANTTAWKVDGSAVTQPVSGTVTSNQGGAPWTVTGTGTAGTAATGVVTVQGIASMTALKTDSSATTQPVSGTVAATQSGTWTVQPGNTANTTAWKVDGSAVTQPVSGTVKAQLQTDGGSAISFGVATAANSLPVTIASNQATFPVTVGNASGAYDSDTGVSGAQTLRVIPAGRLLTTTTIATYDYTGGTVTTAAYTQVIASTTNAINRLYVFDSSGSAIIIASGAAASEVNRLYIPPGGQPSVYELNIPASTRISIKALDTNASTGRLILTGLN